MPTGCHFGDENDLKIFSNIEASCLLLRAVELFWFRSVLIWKEVIQFRIRLHRSRLWRRPPVHLLHSPRWSKIKVFSAERAGLGIRVLSSPLVSLQIICTLTFFSGLGEQQRQIDSLSQSMVCLAFWDHWCARIYFDLNHCSVRFGIFVTDIRSCATELELLVPLYSTEKPSKGKSRTKNRKWRSLKMSTIK